MTEAVILDTLRRINQEVVRASSRDELERAVCDVVSESAPYRFAWIGGYDEATSEVIPWTASGTEDGYLDTVTITVDESPTGLGPTGRAVRTREVQVMQNILDDPAFEPWRAQASERGYQSSIAIPLVHEDEFEGVLNVYADRPNAFDEREQRLLAELGDTVAYALHNLGVQERQRQQHRNLFEGAPVMFVLTRDEAGTAVVDDCNRRFLAQLGYEKDAVVGRPLADFYTEESAQRLREYGYALALDGEFFREDRSFVTADGEVVQTEMRAVPRVGSDGDVVGTLLLCIDVTARKQAEAVLRHAKALDASMDGIAIFNPDGECVYANEAFVSLYGYESAPAVEGEPYDTFLPETERQWFDEDALSTLDARGTWRGETLGLRADGETFPAELSVATVDDGSVVVIVRDVTERKGRERRLREERRRYRTLTETAPDAIFVADPQTHEIVEANSQAVKLTGYDQDELVGMHVEDVHPDDDNHRELFDAHLDSIAEQGPTVRTEFDDGSDVMIRRKDGSTRSVEINANLIHLDEQSLMLGVFRDVTERKERDRRLREFQRQYETVFQNTQDALFLVDVDGDTFRLERFNQTEEDLTGLTTDDHGETIHDVFDGDTATDAEDAYRECLDRCETITYEVQYERDGQTRVWQTKLTPVVVDEEITHLVGAARDITELREYERTLEAQRDQLELLNRIVRHDIRNDMSVVLGFTEILRSEVPEESRDTVDRILKTSRHTVELTATARDLVEMIHGSEDPETTSTDLLGALTDEFENTQRSYPDATFEFEGDAPHVRVRANDLVSAVFRNLFHNAVQHNDGDDPRVSVSVAEGDDHVVVRVADNGPGVPDGRKADVFGKGEKGLESPGTGMGLYFVNRLVGQYGGRVWVEDNDPEGSVFAVELRKAEE